jgi:hypothetical protein
MCKDNDRLIRSFTWVIIERLVSDRMLAAGAAKYGMNGRARGKDSAVEGETAQ